MSVFLVGLSGGRFFEGQVLWTWAAMRGIWPSKK